MGYDIANQSMPAGACFGSVQATQPLPAPPVPIVQQLAVLQSHVADLQKTVSGLNDQLQFLFQRLGI